MNDPIAFFITWNTYGTWLPGDARGWVEYHHGWQLPAPALERECAARMTEDACRLTAEQRRAVERQIAETCAHRGWHLHAVNCRTNHIHVVVTAVDTPPKKVRIDLKAWATRCLKKLEIASPDPSLTHRVITPRVSEGQKPRENWWAERGSIRHIHNEETLAAAIFYTIEAQDRKTEVTRSVSEGRAEGAQHATPMPDESENPSLTHRVTSYQAKDQP